MLLGIAFAVNNFISVHAEAQYVTWETLYTYDVSMYGPPDYIHFCNGETGDCCTVYADAPKQNNN